MTANLVGPVVVVRTGLVSRSFEQQRITYRLFKVPPEDSLQRGWGIDACTFTKKGQTLVIGATSCSVLEVSGDK